MLCIEVISVLRSVQNTKIYFVGKKVELLNVELDDTCTNYGDLII
jgi:hypothetical protein